MTEMTIATAHDEELEGITMDDSADTENEEAPVGNISDKETDEGKFWSRKWIKNVFILALLWHIISRYYSKDSLI